MSEQIPLSEIRLQGNGVCQCGHKKIEHTKTQTICTAWWPEADNVPRSYEERAEIDAMSKEKLQERFGIIYCECVTFVQEGAA